MTTEIRKINKRQFQDLFLMGFNKLGIMEFFRCQESDIDNFCMNAYGESYDDLCKEIEYALKPNQDQDRPYTVYMHIAPNNKKYIGITRCRLNKRWGQGRGYWSNDYFSNAIKKYGWENIQHAILYMRLTKEEAEQKEIELIREFKTADRRYGYNIESGGGLNKIVSQETREKLRQQSTGKKASEETKKRMSISHKGEKCHFFGTHLSDERKQSLRELKSKGVLQINDNGEIVGEYSSMKEASEAFGITRQAISSCCRGKTKKCHGYYWKWKEA